MTPHQALVNLFNASQLASLPARDHVTLQESYQLLLNLINPTEDSKATQSTDNE